MSTIYGPVTGGDKGWPFGASMTDASAEGYSEAEYFIEGDATRYQLSDRAELSHDGHWEVESAGIAPFRTRFIVYKPLDPARFNGTVIVTWNNVTAGHDLFGAESREISRAVSHSSVRPPRKWGLRDCHPSIRGSPPGIQLGMAICTSRAMTTPMTF